MPVRKFRSLADAERSLWREPGDPGIWEAAQARWAIHRALGGRLPPPRRGVRRYRSIEDKQRDPQDITAARAFIQRWAEAGPALEEQRCRELQQLDDETASRMTLDLFRLWRPPEVDDFGAGLVEQQRLFGKLRPIEGAGAKNW